MTHLRTDT